MPVFDDFHQGGPALCVEGLDTEVIEHQQVLPFEPGDFLDIRVVGLCHFQAGEQLWSTRVEYAVPLYAGLMANGCCHIAFTDPGAACDQQVLVAGNKRAIGQAHDLVTVETAIGMVMDIFDHGFITESGLVDLLFYTAIVSNTRSLLVNYLNQRQTFPPWNSGRASTEAQRPG